MDVASANDTVTSCGQIGAADGASKPTCSAKEAADADPGRMKLFEGLVLVPEQDLGMDSPAAASLLSSQLRTRQDPSEARPIHVFRFRSKVHRDLGWCKWTGRVVGEIDPGQGVDFRQLNGSKPTEAGAFGSGKDQAFQHGAICEWVGTREGNRLGSRLPAGSSERN